MPNVFIPRVDRVDKNIVTRRKKSHLFPKKHCQSKVKFGLNRHFQHTYITFTLRTNYSIQLLRKTLKIYLMVSISLIFNGLFVNAFIRQGGCGVQKLTNKTPLFLRFVPVKYLHHFCHLVRFRLIAKNQAGYCVPISTICYPLLSNWYQ